MIRITATCLMLIFFILVAVSFGWTFDWNNKTWKNSGCPSSFQGIWIARETTGHTERSYQVTDNLISFLASEKIESGDSFQVISQEGHYFTLKLFPDPAREPVFKSSFLKIRPYQVNQAAKNGEVPSCFIKVFHYDTRQNVEFGKYKDWDIFILKTLKKTRRR